MEPMEEGFTRNEIREILEQKLLECTTGTGIGTGAAEVLEDLLEELCGTHYHWEETNDGVKLFRIISTEIVEAHDSSWRDEHEF